MTFLAPWFALAAAAIAAPIVLHLIRRDIRGERTFSSLRFLRSATPPPTQKKRLENLLLLLLRAAMLILLAIMFARPFFRPSESAEIEVSGQRVAIIVDTSASMRIGDRYDEARAQVEQLLDSLGTEDRVRIYSASDIASPIAGDWSGRDAFDPPLAELATALRPGWFADDLPRALEMVLADHRTSLETDDDNAALRIYLVSDFASEFTPNWQRIDWPTQTIVELIAVETPLRESNAWIELLANDSTRETGVWRVRITNGHDAASEVLNLTSSNDSLTQTVQVGRGRAQVLEIPATESSTILQLQNGESVASRLALPPARKMRRVVGCLADGAEDRDWILEQAVTSVDAVEVDWRLLESDDLESLKEIDALALLTIPPSTWKEPLQQLLLRGGSIVICVAPSESRRTEEWKELSNSLVPSANLELSRLESGPGFQMIKGVRPLDALSSAAFYDPRFDFGETRIWQAVQVRRDEQQGVVLSELDQGEPCLIRYSVGPGRLFWFTCDWMPDNSQLARSSRFAPLMSGLLGLADVPPPFELATIGDSSDNLEPVELLAPTPPGESPSLSRINVPGLYRRLAVGDRATGEASNETRASATVASWIVAQVPSDQWRVSPGAMDEIRTAGLPQENRINQQASEALRLRERVDDERLEREQRIWRWVLLAVGAVMAVEGWAAWRAVRRPT